MSIGKPKPSLKHPYGVAIFDIETSNLNADFGVVLCGAVMFSGSRRVHVISQRTHCPGYAEGKYDDDGPVIKALLGFLDNAEFWVAHNGQAFDLPFLWTRAAEHGIRTPQPRTLLDPVVLARRKLRLSSNRLAHLARSFDLAPKKELDHRVWRRAILGRDKDAWLAIERHCVADVRALADVSRIMRGFWKNLSSTGAFY